MDLSVLTQDTLAIGPISLVTLVGLIVLTVEALNDKTENLNHWISLVGLAAALVLSLTQIGTTGLAFSGMVTTGRDYLERARPDRFATKYGYFEIRAKIPKGKGLWPAIWLLPSTQEPRPEIDILEVLGHAPDVYEMHLHYLDKKKDWKSEGKNAKVVDLSADWHAYGLEWSKDAVVWYLDGKEMWRYTKPDGISQEPMYLLINLAVGGNWPGSPDARTKFPADFLIDYVRVWRRAGS